MDLLRLPSSLRSHLLGRSYSTSPTTSLLTLSSSTLNSYTLSASPASSDLKRASQFFTRSPPHLLFSTPTFRSFPPSPHPEVAFLGRSNVGKSSLLNALFGRPREKPAHVSKRPGRTKTMNGFGVGGEGMLSTSKKGVDADGVSAAWKRFSPNGGGLIVVDMPGYGSGSRQEWGAEVMKYLLNRKQLRRTYVLVDTEHGLKKSDIQILLHLRQQGITHQVVMSKVDKLLFPGSKMPGPQKVHHGLVKLERTRREFWEMLNRAAGEAGGRDDVMGDILCCSAEKSIDERGRNRRIGIDEVRWSVLTACGLQDIGLSNNKSPALSLDDERDENEFIPYKAFG